MRVLFLAPQPFFIERGTPIAVKLATGVLGERALKNGEEHVIDLLTYHEGQDIEIPGVRQQRMAVPKFLRGWLSDIGPGISLRKLVCDFFFMIAAFRLVRSTRYKYEMVHAVEESVFIALFIKKFFGVPYIYDMDSSLALQTVEKWQILRPFFKIFEALEKAAVRNSSAVVPVCDALAAIAQKHGSSFVRTLSDISLLDATRPSAIDLRKEINAAPHEILAVYIGNLEAYQGIDLLLQSFGQVFAQEPNLRLVVIGGRDRHVAQYQEQIVAKGLSSRAHFLGKRPLADVDAYTLQADILLSPRIRGNNTPMKIYSYLHSGRAILATDLPTHTQVLNAEVAKLAAATPEAFAVALLDLARSETERKKLGTAACALAEEKYTYPVFARRLNELYDELEGKPQYAAHSVAEVSV